MSDDKADDRLTARAARLPADVPPRRDLWPEIRARIGDDPARRSGGRGAWMPAALAASVVVAVGLVALLRATAPEGPAMAGSGEPSSVAATPASFGPSYVLGEQYEEARAGLAREVEAGLADLPPETREVVARNIEAIQAAVAELNDALAKDPGNVFLQQLLLDTYHDELAVLANVRRMTETLSKPERNEI